MRNKFFFGVVVGFFVAVVAFVVFMFFSGTARAVGTVVSPSLMVRQVGDIGVTGEVVAEMVPVGDVIGSIHRVADVEYIQVSAVSVQRDMVGDVNDVQVGRQVLEAQV